MNKDLNKPSKRVLEPHDRISEILFGLIMVLTFTGSLSVVEAGREDIRTMLIGALGCNIAWGVIDGVFYLMGCLAEKARNLIICRAVRNETDPKKAQQLIAGALPPYFAPVLGQPDLESMRLRLMQLPEPPAYARLDGADWLGSVAVFLLVFLSTFPVAVPFIVMKNVVLAKRISSLIGILMLFIAGCVYGGSLGRSRLWFGVSMIVLGGTLVALTVVLGG